MTSKETRLPNQLDEASSPRQNSGLGILLMIGAVLVFGSQDGLSRYLGAKYDVITIVMLRYWFFALFVVGLSARSRGGLREVAKSNNLPLQLARGVLLAIQICIMVFSFATLGLVESHAIFACGPLIVVALSVPVLGEKVGIWRWSAVLVGCIGIFIILDPGNTVFSVKSLVPIMGTVLFACYTLMTRIAGRHDSVQTSFFWTGIGGTVFITCLLPLYWVPPQGADWGWMLLLCITGVGGHYLMIQAFRHAEASLLQPLAYLQTVFASAVGIIIFGEVLDNRLAYGATLIILAGLFTIWRERQRNRLEQSGKPSERQSVVEGGHR